MRDPETGNSKGFAFINFASFEASDAAMDAMNGQYLCNRPITVSYAFKKDSKGERHGSAAERLLAAQNPLSHADRPHQLFADAPVPPMMPGGMGHHPMMPPMMAVPPPPPNMQPPAPLPPHIPPPPMPPMPPMSGPPLPRMMPPLPPPWYEFIHDRALQCCGLFQDTNFLIIKLTICRQQNGPPPPPAFTNNAPQPPQPPNWRPPPPAFRAPYPPRPMPPPPQGAFPPNFPPEGFNF